MIHPYEPNIVSKKLNSRLVRHILGAVDTCTASALPSAGTPRCRPAALPHSQASFTSGVVDIPVYNVELTMVQRVWL